jgi:hypothetical protein
LFAPYTSPELFNTTLRTGLDGAPAAASKFIVPMTLISCNVRLVARVESTTRWVCTMVSTWVARTIRARIECDESVRTNSVRSSGVRGSWVSTPTTTSTSGRCSSAWATRPPQ